MYRMVWTDERMDDFAKHTDQRFDAVDRRFDAVDQRFDAVDQRIDRLEQRVDNGFERVDRRLDGLHQMIHRTMLQLGIGMIVTLALGLVGVIATH
jgi:DNA anti-recombination protein RmuC